MCIGALSPVGGLLGGGFKPKQLLTGVVGSQLFKGGGNKGKPQRPSYAGTTDGQLPGAILS